MEKENVQFERINEPSYIEGFRKHGRQKNRGKPQRGSRMAQFLEALDAEPNQWMIYKRIPANPQNGREPMVQIQSFRIQLENRYPAYDFDHGVDEQGWYCAGRARPRPRAHGAEQWAEEHWTTIREGLKSQLHYHSLLLSTEITANNEAGVTMHVEAISEIKKALDWMENGELQ